MVRARERSFNREVWAGLSLLHTELETCFSWMLPATRLQPPWAPTATSARLAGRGSRPVHRRRCFAAASTSATWARDRRNSRAIAAGPRPASCAATTRRSCPGVTGAGCRLISVPAFLPSVRPRRRASAAAASISRSSASRPRRPPSGMPKPWRCKSGVARKRVRYWELSLGISPSPKQAPWRASCKLAGGHPHPPSSNSNRFS